jgi:endonuclease YncB( thermonuclease family)
MGTKMKTWRALLVLAFAIPTGVSASNIVGRASVIDGDTIDIQGERIRFNGIDAPESRQLCKTETGQDYRCGKVAADALDKFLAMSRPTHCETLNRDRYKRFVANCYRADGASVSEWLVKTGNALDWPRYSKGAYAADQQAAQKDRLGVWSGTFELPWEWRKR